MPTTTFSSVVRAWPNTTLRAGLVDEIGVVVVPAVVGAGTPYLPDGLRLDLRLLDERRFAGGFAALRYAVRR